MSEQRESVIFDQSETRNLGLGWVDWVGDSELRAQRLEPPSRRKKVPLWFR